MSQKLRIDKYHEAVIRTEQELIRCRQELAAASDQEQRNELQHCIRTIEALLPVYRQMERFMAVALGVSEAAN